MTSTEAINRIKNLLFGSQAFSLLKTKDGVEMKVEGDVELEKEIYIITPEGELPAPDEVYEMEDGMEVKVTEGKVESLNYKKMEDVIEEEEVMEDVEVKVEEEVKMVSAELIDGTIVETDAEELKVGDTLFVVTAEGRTEAPTGEHETTEGKIVVVEDGVIMEVKEKEVEEAEVEVEVEAKSEFAEILDILTKGFEHFNSEIESLKKENEELKAGFNKFSAEPAGEKVNSRLAYAEHLEKQRFSKLEALRALRANK